MKEEEEKKKKEEEKKKKKEEEEEKKKVEKKKEKEKEKRGGFYLVRDAVEDLHGQVRDLWEGVRSQVEQHPPDLGVDAVEGHT